jgi:hypothetical protein
MIDYLEEEVEKSKRKIFIIRVKLECERKEVKKLRQEIRLVKDFNNKYSQATKGTGD